MRQKTTGKCRKAIPGLLLALALVLLTAVPAFAETVRSETFEDYTSTDDLSLYCVGYGDQIENYSLSKSGGASGSKALRLDITYDESKVKDRWGTLRMMYPDMAGAETDTGFRFWAKSSVPNMVIELNLFYNNQTWKMGTTVDLTTTGKYYDLKWSDLKLTYGTCTYPGRETDPTLINEWQFTINKKDSGINGAVVYLDDVMYTDASTPAAPSGGTTTNPGTTTKPGTTTNPGTTQNPGTTTQNPGATTQTPTPGATVSETASELTSGEETVSDTGSEGTDSALDASDVDVSSDESDAAEADDNGSGGLGAGAIAGIVVGAVVVLGGAGAAVWYFLLRKKGIPTDGPDA